MAKDKPTPKTDETQTTQPPAADPPGDAASPSDSVSSRVDEKPVDKTISLAEAERMIAKAVKEAEKKAAAAEAKAKLGETERLAKELEEMRDEVRMRDARDAIGEALRAAGARNPQLLFAAVRDQLEFDDAGKLKDLDALVTDLKATYPEQFGKEETKPVPPGSIDGGAGGRDKPAGLTAAELAKMTPQEIAKLPWNDVKAAMVATK